MSWVTIALPLLLLLNLSLFAIATKDKAPGDRSSSRSRLMKAMILSLAASLVALSRDLLKTPPVWVEISLLILLAGLVLASSWFLFLATKSYLRTQFGSQDADGPRSA